MTVPTARAWIGNAGNRVECVVLSAVIHHGRDDPTTQPDASTAVLEVLGPLPAAAVIGARLQISAFVNSSNLTRFEGEITDLEVGWDDVDIARPRIIAAGDLGRIGRRLVGDAPWPAELDGTRVNRVLALAGFTPDPTRTDPGTVQLLARDVDRQPALTVAQDAAGDGGGIVWQDVTGRVLYADALHRRGSAVAYEFDACDLSLGLGWAQTLEGLANDVDVRYGPTPSGGVQASVHARDTTSIAERGTYAASLSTAIATAPDAQRRADELVARQSEPAWVLGGLEVNLALLDMLPTYDLLRLVDVHKLVRVTGLPAGSPATTALLWVEGWRETLEGVEGGGVAWSIAFATSDYCRTAAPPLWDDVPAATTWATVDPALTWDRAVCMPPAASLGRWNDVAASLRWDQLGPDETWDTWAR